MHNSIWETGARLPQHKVATSLISFSDIGSIFGMNLVDVVNVLYFTYISVIVDHVSFASQGAPVLNCCFPT